MNHWKELADQIGADVPDEPFPPEPEIESEVPADDAPIEEPSTNEPMATTPPDEKKAESTPAPTASEPRAKNHWGALAGDLGIEVPEPDPDPEPDPEPEPEPVVGFTPEPDPEPVVGFTPEPEPAVGFEPEQPPEPEVAPEAIEEASPAEPKPAWGVDIFETPPAEPQAADDDDSEPRKTPENGQQMPLFEDPELSLETPWVLDAIFDEEETKPTQDAPPPTTARIQAEDVESKVDEKAEEPEPAATVRPDEVAEKAEDPEEKRSKRRRRRRRRRPSRKEKSESSDDKAEPGAEAAAPSAGDDLSDGDGGEEADPSDRRDKGEEAKLKHRKIPTWEEAIDIVISTNREARAKNPNSGSRGRRRGRK